jgi:SAM-dependent methyltransferase
MTLHTEMRRQTYDWTPAYWQGWREVHNVYRRYKSGRDRQIALDFVQPRNGDRILEVGCGYGFISEALWKTAAIHWVGVDRSDSMLSRLTQTHGPHPVLQADAGSLPFADASFDKVLCTGVLMHVDNDRAALRELVRVLLPGGTLLCSINNALSPFSLPVRLRNSFKPGFVQNFRRPSTFRSYLCTLGLQPGKMAGDGIIATVPLCVGRFSLPPQSAFPLVRFFDEWAVSRFAWLAYELWFGAVKSPAACAS